MCIIQKSISLDTKLPFAVKCIGNVYLLPHRESADKVVLHTGKYEELIVCSHEIAASTAQLVAASKVMIVPPRKLC